MANTLPTAAEFKARYPKFAAVSDVLADAALGEGSRACGSWWPEGDWRDAVMAHAAHSLLEEGALSSAPPSPTTGAVKRVKAGDVETEFDTPGARLTGADAASLGATVYGRRFLAIRARFTAAGVLVV